ncbi:MAG: thioredoxin domain-containing protein [Dehalococcoidia bacterium]
MSNRQARREQSRTTRTSQRSRQSGTPGRSSRPSSGGGGGSSIFSTGFLVALGAVAVVLVIAAVAFTQFFGSEGEDDQLVQNLEEAGAALPLDMMDGNTIGSDDAPVKITEYEDTQCPFCLRYTANVEPDLIEEFVKTGKVQITYKHLPLLGNESTFAAMALTCAADQNEFWPYHNKLFTVQAAAGQSTNEQVDVGRFSEDKLKGYAGELGLDRTAFDACYADPETLTEVSAQQREAQGFGVNSTPGFIVNGSPAGSGSPTIEGWRTIIEQAMAATTTTATTTTTSPAATTSPSATASATPSN